MHDGAQLDTLIRQALVDSVRRVEPHDELFSRIVGRCSAAPVASPGWLRRGLRTATSTVVRFLIEALQVNAVCHGVAPLDRQPV